MKKIKTVKTVSQVTKISDFFSRNSDNKSSKCDSNKTNKNNVFCGSDVLESVTNLSRKSTPPVSPTSKRIKHNENYIPLLDINDSSSASAMNNFKVETPKKFMRPSTSMKTPNSKSSSKSRTPQSGKKGTPKKLFDKSPRKLEEFNVKLFEAFVQVSPSTSNKKIELTPNKSNESSHLSKTSNRASVQNLNETTPSKIVQLSPVKSPRVRTKLSFLESCDIAHKIELPDPEVVKHEIKEELIDTLDDEFDDLLSKMEEYNLNLKDPERCIILELKKWDEIITLKLKSLANNDLGYCNIEEFWVSGSHFEVGNIIFVAAAKIKNNWVVNNDNGWVVYEPDFLLSCTTVLGSVYCKRKTVLSEGFRSFEGPNIVMLVGTLTHSLLQQALKNKLKTESEIRSLMKSLLATKDSIKRLYESDLCREEVEHEMEVFIPKLVQFISEYVNKEAPPQSHNWQGKIGDIEDIEENFWCPDLGLKGKIDVTLKTDSGVVPLELKTGRATVSLEHRGQVIMYIMMMNKFGYKVSSGLLLYLKEGVLKEIKATPQEKRDVLILRNELAYFLSNNVPTLNKPDDLKKAPKFPEPLINHRACGNCPYNTICTSLLKYENHDLSQNHKIQEIQRVATSHLTEEHLNYFIKWINFLNLESDSKKIAKSVQQIYTALPTQREAMGKCVVNLVISHVGENQNGLYEHKFVKKDPNFNFTSSNFLENNYVIVSTNVRPAVAAGYINNISSNFISIFLDRNLNKNYCGQIFHLDTYETNSSYTFNMSCIATLMENTPRTAELRSIIIDKKPPTFLSKLPSVVAKKGAGILKRLNKVQQRAVLKALCAQDYLLIKGMPGTGKTATIVALIQLLVELDKSVLVTSHTHSAIDNICLRLQKRGIDFLRLGSVSKIDEKLKIHSEATILQDCNSPEELEEAYAKYKVIAVTCLGSGHPLLSKRILDVCIVDESTQVLQTSVIRTLSAAKTFVLIGDPDQLAPVVRNRTASEAGMSESLFERLDNSEGKIALNLNYRMNQTITNLANVLTYKGELKTANDIVANRRLEIPELEAIKIYYKKHTWLLKVLDTSLESAVQIIDTGPVWQLPQNMKWHPKILKNSEEFENQNYFNPYEVAVIVTVVKALILGGVPTTEIGVIATYTFQVAQIANFLEPLEVDVSTVDQFQGRDKNVILFSSTKSFNPAKKTSDKKELLEDKRRLTVAMTRAKRKLIIVGDVAALKTFTTFSAILPVLEKQMIYFDSSWDLVNDF